LCECGLCAWEIERESFGWRAIFFGRLPLCAVRANGIRECNEVCIVDIVCESEELCVVVGTKAKFVILGIHGRGL
jgi:hypothetical protein